MPSLLNDTPFYKDIVSQLENPVNTDDIQLRKKTVYNSKGEKLSEWQQKYTKDSKESDSDGNPRVVYHGTSNGTFTGVKTGEVSHRSLIARYAAGFCFDTDRKSSSRYTEQDRELSRILPCVPGLCAVS